MDFSRLTIKSQEAVAAAQDDARRRGNPELTPDHLLLALNDDAARTLFNHGTKHRHGNLWATRAHRSLKSHSSRSDQRPNAAAP